jgi:hypothetical protein
VCVCVCVCVPVFVVCGACVLLLAFAHLKV